MCDLFSCCDRNYLSIYWRWLFLAVDDRQYKNYQNFMLVHLVHFYLFSFTLILDVSKHIKDVQYVSGSLRQITCVVFFHFHFCNFSNYLNNCKFTKSCVFPKNYLSTCFPMEQTLVKDFTKAFLYFSLLFEVV